MLSTRTDILSCCIKKQFYEKEKLQKIWNSLRSIRPFQIFSLYSDFVANSVSDQVMLYIAFYILFQSDRYAVTLLTCVLHIGCMKICNYIKGPAFCALLISTFHFSFLATQNMVYCKYFNVLVSLLLNKQVTSRILRIQWEYSIL